MSSLRIGLATCFYARKKTDLEVGLRKQGIRSQVLGPEMDGGWQGLKVYSSGPRPFFRA